MGPTHTNSAGLVLPATSLVTALLNCILQTHSLVHHVAKPGDKSSALRSSGATVLGTWFHII